MIRRLSYIITMALALSCLSVGVSHAEPDNDTALSLYIGQYYPSGQAYLVPLTNEEDGSEEASAQTKTAPKTIQLASFPNQAETPPSGSNSQSAKRTGYQGDVYPPYLEHMPADDMCGSNHRVDPQNQYLDITQYPPNMPFTDFFNRGMPDNCEPEQMVAQYMVPNWGRKSIPVIAVADIANFTVDQSNAGKPRPLTATEREQVAAYKADYIKSYEAAYDENYDIGDILSLADAHILFELKLSDDRRSVRVSHWQSVSIADHLYLVIVVDELVDGIVINTSEYRRAQGVL
ncbi:hypothetical protein ACFOWX_11920 [Sphingorhabdus arenilitoris]|uniref:Uncharacterized protein n=1 Tax=Sphingorhabdus arenilitoris TaxID=1490041 RepID=A0ABV8RIM2_9SPHN